MFMCIRVCSSGYVCVNIVFHVLFCYSLGQACNHVAALLFFIESHVHDDKLPTEKSKTSLSMKWNQPSQKAVTPARAKEMTFIKPSHVDLEQRVPN